MTSSEADSFPQIKVWWRWGVAALGGAALAAAFPPLDLGWPAFAAPFLLMLALRPPGADSRHAAASAAAWKLGWLFGAVFFLALLHWLPRLPRENISIPFFMYPAALLIAAYLGFYISAVSAISMFLVRRRVHLWLAFPVVWLLVEYVRSTGVFGFAWGAVAYAMAPMPHLTQFAHVTGTWGVGLWVLGINAAIYAYLDAREVWGKSIAGLVVVSLLLGAFFYGRSVLTEREPMRAVRVGIVQPNVGKDKWKASVREDVITNLLSGTEQLAQESAPGKPAVVIWPETAYPGRLSQDPVAMRRVYEVVTKGDVPLLAGYPDGLRLPDGSWEWTNSAGLVMPGQGLVAQYNKRHLVPFSEYMPIPILNRFDFGQGTFIAGDGVGVFEDLAVPFGVLICFESTFPGEARRSANHGARYLVNITNDQWFGDSAEPAQHFNMNILRCIENQLAMVRVANTGVSGVIDPYGFVTERTSTFVRDMRTVSVELGPGGTFYARTGDWIVGVVLGLFFVLLGAGLWRGKGRGQPHAE